MLPTTARVLVVALAVAALAASSSSKESEDRQPSAEVAAPTATAPARVERKPVGFDEALAHVLVKAGYTAGELPPMNSKAMRDAIATALGIMAVDQDRAIVFTPKKTTLTVSVFDGGGCSKDMLSAFVDVARESLQSVGFTRLRCDPEGYSVAVK